MPNAPPAPPPEAAALAACLGADGTLLLIEARGGMRVHVPTPSHAARSKLAQLLPADGLALLAAEFGGLSIEIPLCREWRARVMLHAGGRSHAEIAHAVRISRRQVRRLSCSDWTPVTQSHRREARPVQQFSLDV